MKQEQLDKLLRDLNTAELDMDQAWFFYARRGCAENRERYDNALNLYKELLEKYHNAKVIR